MSRFSLSFGYSETIFIPFFVFILIIPFSHSLSLDPYRYLVPDMWLGEIVLGGLVSIPFGKQDDQGIIVGFTVPREEEREKIRPIHTVLSSTPILAPYQIEMIFRLSARYFIPLHKALKMLLPAPLLSRLDKKNYCLDTTGRVSPSENIREILHLRDSHIKYIQNIKNTGSVFLFPDDFFILSEQGLFPPETTILFSEATPTKKSRIWMSMYEGKEKIIVGTRRLLYYNLQAFSHVYYIEDAFGDEDYQYPTNLRNLDILRFLADTSDISISVLTSTPSLELFAKFRDFKIKHL